MVNAIVDAGGTHQLADYDTLRPVDYKRSSFGHQGQISHKYLMFINFIRFLVIETDPYLQRSCIGSIAFFTLFNCIFGIFFLQRKVRELQTQLAAVICNRRNIRKGFAESFVQKPLVGISLDFYQIRHFKNFLLP